MPDSASLPSAVKLAWAFGPAPYTSRPAPVVQDPSSAIGPGHFNCSRSLHFFSPTFFLFYSPSLFYFCPSLPSVRHLEQTLLPFSYPGYAVIPYISITTVCPDRFPAARSTRRIYRRRSGLHPRRFFSRRNTQEKEKHWVWCSGGKQQTQFGHFPCGAVTLRLEPPSPRGELAKLEF